MRDADLDLANLRFLTDLASSPRQRDRRSAAAIVAHFYVPPSNASNPAGLFMREFTNGDWLRVKSGL